MRLIDADELSNVMYHQAFETDTDSQKWDSGCWIRYKMFENAIESAPTADPVTHETAIDFLSEEGWLQEHDRILTESAVKRGRWEDCSNGWMCSVCKHDARKDYQYCPHCGAYMIDEED